MSSSAASGANSIGPLLQAFAASNAEMWRNLSAVTRHQQPLSDALIVFAKAAKSAQAQAVDMAGLTAYFKELSEQQASIVAGISGQADSSSLLKVLRTVQTTEAVTEPRLADLLVDVKAFQSSFTGTEIEQAADDLIERNPDVAQAIENMPLLIQLDDAGTRSAIIWFTKIVVTLLTLSIMLDVAEAIPPLSGLLGALGFGAAGVGNAAGNQVARGLDRLSNPPLDAPGQSREAH